MTAAAPAHLGPSKPAPSDPAIGLGSAIGSARAVPPNMLTRDSFREASDKRFAATPTIMRPAPPVFATAGSRKVTTECIPA